MKHTCKAPNCTAQISEQFLMCGRHWGLVPRAIQLRVHRAWRALNRGLDHETFEAYQAAVTEAINSVSPDGLITIEKTRALGKSPLRSSASSAVKEASC